jgi:hypothetical protein
MKVFFLLLLVCVAACSTQRQNLQDETVADTSDPFNDPFFTQPPEWDSSVLHQSEVLTQDEEKPEKPPSLLERSEGVIFSTIVVGLSLGKLALPFLGF